MNTSGCMPNRTGLPQDGHGPYRPVCSPQGCGPGCRRTLRSNVDPRDKNLQSVRPSPTRPAPAFDPNRSAGLLQNGRTASHRFSCFASTKRPFVTSHTWPSSDHPDDASRERFQTGSVSRVVVVSRFDAPAPASMTSKAKRLAVAGPLQSKAPSGPLATAGHNANSGQARQHQRVGFGLRHGRRRHVVADVDRAGESTAR
jgi:hypothetical protein